MGKYFRKSKLTGDVVAVMDVSPSSLGVRTRAKTLAFQKLQASSKTADSPELIDDVAYLQLRSRKLEKPQQIVLEASCDLGSQEASFADNNIEFDARDRGTRESTPCSFIRESNDVITPGSSTRSASRHASNRITQRIMPSAQEIEEFFALHVQEQQRLFSEKYNFDIVNEKPLKGRYEWVRADM